MPQKHEPLITRLRHRVKELKNSRQRNWEETWRMIGYQMAPGRLMIDEPKHRGNRGERIDMDILNEAPVFALDTCKAGLMAGITNPAREWWDAEPSDKALAEQSDVKNYIEEVKRRVNSALQRWGFYWALGNGGYEDVSAFATAVIMQEEREDDPGSLVYESIPVGRYWLAVDERGVVDTLVVQHEFTVRQMVQKFSRNGDRVSPQVQKHWDNGNMATTFTVMHCVVPNEDYAEGSGLSINLPWRSYWYEESYEKEKDDTRAFNRISGYHEFPALVPRWDTRGRDAYGRGPGWKALGSCQVLQHRELGEMEIVDKLHKPPMRASAGVKRASLLPSSVTYSPRGQELVYEPAIDTGALARAFPAVAETKAEIVKRIERAFFVDLWRFLLDDTRAQRATATEVEETRQQVMLMLGPVLQNLDRDLLEPAITRAYNVLERSGQLPPPPQSMIDQPLRIRFISVLHQLQKATGLGALRSLVEDVAQLAQLSPEALDKLNYDTLVDEFASILGVRPDAVLDEDEVARVRDARAEIQQAQQQGEAMLSATEGARNLAAVQDPQQLGEILRQFAPAQTAQAGLQPPLQ